jgi:hypothetical protein
LTATGGLATAGLPGARAADAVQVAVTAAGDAALTAGCSDGSTGRTLREALCEAAVLPDAVVQVPPGSRTTLVAGPLTYAPAAAATLLVTSTGTYTVDGAGRRVLDLDPGLVGGVDVTLDRVELIGGTPSAADAVEVGGGGAVLAGTGDPGAPDSLTLRRCVVTGNANASGAGDATAPGGAVQMNGGTLTVDACTFTGNAADGASGGAIAMLGAAPTDTVLITGSTFEENTVTGTAAAGVLGGGAVFVTGAALTITDSVFTGNRVTTVAPSTGRGGAVQATGTTTVTGTRVEGTRVAGAGGTAAGGALWLAGGQVTGSVLVGNTDTVTGTERPASVVGPVSATGSWWGSGAAPADAEVGAHGVTTTVPRAVLGVTVDPEQPRTGDAVTALASVVMADGSAPPSALLARLRDRTVTWSDGGLASATTSTQTTLQAAGTAALRFTRSAAATGTLSATVDGVAATATLDQPVLPTVGRPADADAAEGETVIFTAATTGSPAPALQWRQAAPGAADWTDVPGATSASLEVTADRRLDGTRYRLVATNSVGAVPGPPATLTVRWGPEITAQPADVAGLVGSTVRFTVGTAGSPAPAVQWQRAPAGGSAWVDVPGATAADHDHLVTADDEGLQMRARVTGAGAEVVSDAATITALTAPAFTTSPGDATVVEGEMATFSVTVTGAPAPAVRWQHARAGTGDWTDVPGATGTSLGVVADRTLQGDRYRAVASSTAGSAPSAPAALTVQWAPTVTQQPGDAAVLTGSTARFQIAVAGYPLPTVRWQQAPAGTDDWADVPGATGVVHQHVTADGDDGLRVRAVVENAAGAVTTEAATLTVQRAPALGTQPADVTADAGTDATFTAAADGVPAPALRWQSRTPGGAWADVSGATSGTLTVAATPALHGSQYRAVATSTVGEVPSDPATLTVLTAPVVSDPVDVTVGAGDDARFAVLASGRPAPAVSWETSADGLVWSAVPDITGEELVRTVVAADDGLLVRAVATATLVARPVTTTSEPAVLTVLTLPEVTVPPAGVAADGSVAARAGAPLTLSWVVDAEAGTATWRASRDGGRTWGALPAGARVTQEPVSPGASRLGVLLAALPTSGPTRHAVVYTPTVADDGLMLRLDVTNLAGTTSTDPVTLRVAAAPTTPVPAGPVPGAPTVPAAPAGPSAGPASGAAAARGPLAVTGADVVALTGTALTLLLGGGVVVLGVRRRRS